MYLPSRCKRCKKDFVPGAPRWKCCQAHCSPNGMDFVCDNCAVRLHPDNAAIVRHKWFDENDILPCCGLSRYEVLQSDQITPDDEEVTCTGRKRYLTKEKA